MIAPEVASVVTPLTAPALMIMPLIVLVAVAPVMAPLRPKVLTALTAPLFIIIPLMVFVAVAPEIAPDRPRVVTPETAPLAMATPLMAPVVVNVVTPPKVPVIVELPVIDAPPEATIRPVKPPSVPAIVELPLTAMPLAETVRLLAWVLAPLTSTLYLLVPLFCKSIRLPVGEVVLLLARIKACPAEGSLVPDCKILKAELVPELVRLSTPAAPVLVLLKPSKLPTNEALEVSLVFLAMKLPPPLQLPYNGAAPTPPDRRHWPAATSANLLSVVAPEAKSRSPTA